MPYYQFDQDDSAANISSLAGAGTTLTITDNGGFQGSSGVGFQLTAVPEPSAYAGSTRSRACSFHGGRVCSQRGP